MFHFQKRSIEIFKTLSHTLDHISTWRKKNSLKLLQSHVKRVLGERHIQEMSNLDACKSGTTYLTIAGRIKNEAKWIWNSIVVDHLIGVENESRLMWWKLLLQRYKILHTINHLMSQSSLIIAHLQFFDCDRI